MGTYSQRLPGSTLEKTLNLVFINLNLSDLLLLLAQKADQIRMLLLAIKAVFFFYYYYCILDFGFCQGLDAELKLTSPLPTIQVYFFLLLLLLLSRFSHVRLSATP